MKKIICHSCHKELTNDKGATRFPCPECGGEEIVRCLHCRELGARYKCKQCEFEGPN